MPKTPPPKGPLAANAFGGRTASADAMRSPAVAPPPPPPTKTLRSVPHRDQAADERRTIESEPPRTLNDERSQAGSEPRAYEPRSIAIEERPTVERIDDAKAIDSPTDQLNQVDQLISEAVLATQRQDHKAIPEIVQRIASVSARNKESLGALLEAVLAVPSAGKAQIPLEIAPPLHQKLKADANRLSRPGAPVNMTTLVLSAIGEAHESGRIDDLVKAHKAGERHKVPLFGNLKVGTAPRGETKRMQFQPPTTARIMVDILAAWHRVDFVVLVRLALDAQYGRKSKRAADSGDQDHEST